MSNAKVLLHRICNSVCSKSREQMIAKFAGGVRMKGGGVLMNACARFFNDKLAALKAISMQCNVIAAHRVRRSAQIFGLYRSLYGDKTPIQFFKKLGEILHKNPDKKLMFVIGAALFDWKQNSISDREMLRVEDELKAFFDTNSNELNIHDQHGETWENLVDQENFKLWRCPVKGSSLYKYKVFGTYKDIPPSAFIAIQLDLDYRKTWDSHVVTLEKVEEDATTGSEVIYWATKFPGKVFYDRDYCYVRRVKIDKKTNIMTLSAKSIDHPHYPPSDNYVRVSDYTSQMSVRAHTTFDENGLDYVMSYCDNPQVSAPSWIINNLSQKQLPGFLEQLHQAAINLNNSRSASRSQRHANQTEQNNNNNMGSCLMKA
ncbi:StAR-related lipid transfer protein 7 [Mactra antiquata]